jgi:hypothetical protein
MSKLKRGVQWQLFDTYRSLQKCLTQKVKLENDGATCRILHNSGISYSLEVRCD